MADAPKPAVPFTEIKRAMVSEEGTVKVVEVVAFTFEADSPENMFCMNPFSGRWDYKIPTDLQGYFIQLGAPRMVWCTFKRTGFELLPVRAVVGMDLISLES